MRFTAAIIVSVAVHLLIGLGLWYYLEYVFPPDVLATLDLSSVELSFTEEEDELSSPREGAWTTESVRVPTPRPPAPDLRPPGAHARTIEEKLPLPDTPVPHDVDIPQPVEQPQLSAPAPKQARVDAPPRPQRTIRPDYPKGARLRGEQGDVVVEMLVNAEGTVDNAKVVTSSGFPELDDAALRAVRAAKFTPAKSGREAVASTARITLTFKLK